MDDFMQARGCVAGLDCLDLGGPPLWRFLAFVDGCSEAGTPHLAQTLKLPAIGYNAR